MREFGKQLSERTDGAKPPTLSLSRRRVLQGSAGALAAVGLGLASGTAGAQTGSVPRYADFVPDDDRFVRFNGATEVTSADIEQLITAIAQPSEDDD
ncbi:MAG: hypothetical protein ACI8TL_001725, partial [Natronomonas sp.]